jgi:acyl-CoA synthetase (AMP-forming)/AMP-acid ligase II
MFDRIYRFYRAGKGLLFANPASNQTIAYQFEQHAMGDNAARPFLIYRDRRFSYAEANKQVNRHSSAFKGLGLKKGDVVALVMENRPEFLWHYLGAAKLGVIVSLINTHNTGKPLAHSIRICDPKLIIVGSEVAESFEQIRDELGLEAPTYVDTDAESAPYPALPPFSALLLNASDANPQESSQNRLDDQLAYIYTSGTTGLPKAARVRNQKVYAFGQAVGALGFEATSNDVIYNCLPLYHMNGIGVCTGSVITWGACMVLARKFSASRFWDDCRKHECTAFIYIGELCRYLMNTPPKDNDADNKVRVVVGNGLRPDIWEAFQKRFGIERVAEFYGSTEGNIGTINFDNTAGSVGRLLFGGALVKFDADKEDFVRDAKGFCIKCKAGEPGVLIGEISNRARFDGYQDKDATSKKILRDVFKKGDAYFNTGDLLRMDGSRRLFFVDRMGDTFRWKGENVSTFEVQEQLSSWRPAKEANVYGVQVGATEGKAGMASVVLDEGQQFDPGTFKTHVDSSLPPYARPLFVRVRRELDTTATLKLKKQELKSEGFDPRKVEDPLYFRHPDTGNYVEMTEELYDDVIQGKLRL